MFSWAKFSIGLGLSVCVTDRINLHLQCQVLAPGGRGGPSPKASNLPSRAMWYELLGLVASA